MLPHAIYFDTLASIGDDSSQEWKTTSAGLVVLRLVDDWLDFGPQIVATDITALRTVRDAIARISEGNPVRVLLGQIVNALEEAEDASIGAVTPPLLAYAQALQYAGLSSLEEDVLLTLHKYAKVADDSQTVVLTSIRLGIVARTAGKFELADEYHLSAAEQAYAIGDIGNALLARLGYAKTTSVRGNVGKADALCASVVEDAAKSGLHEMLGRALHDRAYMAYLRKDYQGVVRFAHQALEHIVTPRLRDRVLADLAAGFVELGHVTAARDTNLILVSCAEEQVIRWQATLSLMYSAAKERQEDTFELYRAALGCVQLPPREEIYYRWAAGYGFRVFGDVVRAEEELQQAHAMAEQYNMQQLVFELEEELTKQPVGEWSADIDSIALAIGEQLQFNTVSMV